MVKVFLSFSLAVSLVLQSLLISVGATTVPLASGVVITHIQAGATGAATQEFIVLYNNSDTDIDISRWCLTNKANATIGCFDVGIGEARFIPAQKHAVAASTTYAAAHTDFVATILFAPLSQSSGSITGGGDTVSLLDQAGVPIDKQTWATSLAAGMQYERKSSGVPPVYIDTDMATDWTVTPPGVVAHDETIVERTIIDICPNIEGIQQLLPVGKVLSPAGECIDRIVLRVDITELLPNAVGADDGNEFIELYNPNDAVVDLAGYALYVGPQLTDKYYFPPGSVIAPRSYMVFTNTDIRYTLLNTSSKVLLALKDGTVVSETVAYDSPLEGQSWVYIDGVWMYSSLPTPGAPNVYGSDAIDTATTAKPCALNQYRSPETNRCRLLSTLGVAITPCKDGQYRSEETNRCRNIASETKSITPCAADQERNPDTGRCRKIATATPPAPCKPGQERNPDTNRCRTVTKMTNAGYAIRPAKSDNNSGGYVFAAIGGVLLLAAGYAVWEWHVEIKSFFRKRYMMITRLARIHK